MSEAGRSERARFENAHRVALKVDRVHRRRLPQARERESGRAVEAFGDRRPRLLVASGCDDGVVIARLGDARVDVLLGLGRHLARMSMVMNDDERDGPWMVAW